MNGQDTLVGLNAKDVLEFLSSRNKGYGYYLVPGNVNNIINFTLTAGKIKKSSVYLKDEYVGEIFS